MNKQQVKLACMTSGEGAEVEAIVKSWRDGMIPEISEIVLLYAGEDPDNVTKAESFGINYELLPSVNGVLSLELFKNRIGLLGGADLIFMAGSIVCAPNIGIPVYNYHPADPDNHWGRRMHGLTVYKRVLNQIDDRIRRGAAKKDDRFFMQLVVHEVLAEYVKGAELIRMQIEIPKKIIIDKTQNNSYEAEPEKRLQGYISFFEKCFLPTGVRLAALMTLFS